jgi:hypothetical protein
VAFDVERLLRLWTDPLPADDDAAAAAFRAVYTDPVEVNGAAVTAADLVARARAMQQALAGPEREVLEVVEAGAAVAVAFRLAGRLAGELGTPAGPVAGSGQRIDLRVVDVLGLAADGRITRIVMVADWLGALAPAGLAQLAG